MLTGFLKRGSVIGWGLALAMAAVLACGGSAAAQTLRAAGGLGGYGAASGVPMGSMGSGSLIIPYGGQFAGFMPARMGGGANLAFTSRQSAAIGSNRRPFSLSSMSGGAGMKSGSTLGSTLGSGRGLDLGSPSGMSGMSSGLRSSVAPPSFAYPFYQPPPFFPTTTTGTGMSSM